VTHKHIVETSGPLIAQPSGVCFVPVAHEGNTQGSPEEVEHISAIANELIGSPYWPDPEGHGWHKLGEAHAHGQWVKWMPEN
jgi:uncharacterized protein